MKSIFDNIKTNYTDEILEKEVDSNLESKEASGSNLSPKPMPSEHDAIPDIDTDSVGHRLYGTISFGCDVPEEFPVKLKLKDAGRRKVTVASTFGFATLEFKRDHQGLKQFVAPNKQYNGSLEVLSSFKSKNGVVISSVLITY